MRDNSVFRNKVNKRRKGIMAKVIEKYGVKRLSEMTVNELLLIADEFELSLSEAKELINLSK